MTWTTATLARLFGLNCVLSAAAIALSACGPSDAEKAAAKEAEARQAAYQAKYAKAKALFEERCKTAGVVIHRTVKDVEGIELTKVRQPVPWGGKEYFDPMWAEAAMAGETRGNDFVKQFLVYEYREPHQLDGRGQLGPLTQEKKARYANALRGYSYVEYADSSDGKRRRCKADWSRNHPNWVDGQLECEAVQSSKSRYALDYEDLVDPAGRELWVAGTRLKVIDKHTGEVIAELRRYVWDPGFGGSATGRWPWQHATTAASTVCPSDASQPLHHDSRYFVDQILIPKQGD